ncbi:MAG TPA: GIY-YIG nuclease family protein [Dehalococcoidia bacterium]|nr:GIY-YIG nuclease family protein [Dehalococcoidia bacterium]
MTAQNAPMPYHVYIMSNPRRTTLYIGVTGDLFQRVYQHKQRLLDGFTRKYLLTDLVYFEETSDVNEAITREKQLKGWRRDRKAALVEAMNPRWQDLSEDWY